MERSVSIHFLVDGEGNLNPISVIEQSDPSPTSLRSGACEDLSLDSALETLSAYLLVLGAKLACGSC